VFAAFEAKLEKIWHTLDGEARAEWEKIKSSAAQFAPLVSEAKTDLLEIAKDVEPEVKTALESRLGQLVTAAEALLKDVPGL
jgi:hypothetical protein